MTKFPGWRTMTGVQRRNAKMEVMFEHAYELAASKAGWIQHTDGDWYKPDLSRPDTEWPWYDTAREVCAAFDLLGLRGAA